MYTAEIGLAFSHDNDILIVTKDLLNPYSCIFYQFIPVVVTIKIVIRVRPF